jgi:hypothetical protein
LHSHFGGGCGCGLVALALALDLERAPHNPEARARVYVMSFFFSVLLHCLATEAAHGACGYDASFQDRM